MLVISGCFLWFDLKSVSKPLHSSEPAEVTGDPMDFANSDISRGLDSVSGQPSANEPVTEPGVEQALLARIEQLTSTGEYLAAQLLLEEAIKTHPKSPLLLMDLGLVLLADLKQPEKALKVFESLVEIDSGHRGALSELELLYEELNSISEGIEFFERLSQSTTNPELHYARAKLLTKAGRGDESLESFIQALALTDIREQVLLDLAEAAFAAKSFERSNDAYSSAIALQEKELDHANSDGFKTFDFLEERLTGSKISFAKSLAVQGRIDEAESLLDSIKDPEANILVASARREIGLVNPM
jgi:tetratricopeptide (TPR) repeat protein